MNTCTSGRRIPEIGLGRHNPCGRQLVVVGYTTQGHPVEACPLCDVANTFPSRRAKR